MRLIFETLFLKINYIYLITVGSIILPHLAFYISPGLHLKTVYSCCPVYSLPTLVHVDHFKFDGHDREYASLGKE